MLFALVQAAFRSIVLALIVWLGLRIFRVRNIVLQRCAWTTVLIGSLLMPIALGFTAHWRALPFAAVPSSVSLDRLQSALAPPASKSGSTASSRANLAVMQMPNSRRSAVPATTASLIGSAAGTPVPPSIQRPAADFAASLRASFDVQFAALLIYVLVAAALSIRLLLGLIAAMRLWRSSTPIAPDSHPQIDPQLNVRFSLRISTPVTIGTGIVLPAGYSGWSEEKLRVVLAHERSHVSGCDFHVQILASLYASLTWFSPLAWWLKYKLSELGEAIGDGSGLDAASNRTAYAQVLLEFAAAPRPTLIGVAMARPSSISRRIERLLNDNYLRHALRGDVRGRVAVLVVPVILFAGATLVRVQAATRPAPSTHALATTAATSQPPLPATIAHLSPPVLPELALATPPGVPAPAPVLENGEAQAEATFDRSLSFSGQLDLSVGTASGNITFTQGAANQVRIHGIVKANRDGDPAQVQQIAANPPIEQEGNTIKIGAHREDLHNISISYEIEAPADTLLNAATASGNVTDTGVGHGAKLTTASGNINATGLEGGFKLETGSGNIAIDKIGQGDAKAQTGSGNIDLKGVNGALQAQTGSGTIKATGTPASPWKLQTGSGNIELATGNAPMNLDASTGSGSISTTAPVAMQNSENHHHLQIQLNGGGPEVHAETGSGNIRIN